MTNVNTPAPAKEGRPKGAKMTVTYNQAEVELVSGYEPGALYAVVQYPGRPELPWSVRTDKLEDRVHSCAGCGQTVERNAKGYWADQFGRVTCPPSLNPMATGGDLDPFHEPEDAQS